MMHPAPTDEQVRLLLAKFGLEDGVVGSSPYEGAANYVRLVGPWCVRVLKDEAFADDVRREAIVVPAVRAAGVATPELVGFDDSREIVPGLVTLYRRLDGMPLGLIDQAINREAIARQLGEQILRWRFDVKDLDLPRQQGQRAKACYLRAKTRLSPAECAWVESALERLAATTDVPDEFVHNDLHRHNLMILDDQLEAVIDWGSAGFGDPALNYHCLPMDWLPLLLPPDADANFVGRCLDYMLGYALNDIHRQARGGPNSHTGHLRWQALLRFTNLGLRDDWRYWLQDAPVN